MNLSIDTQLYILSVGICIIQLIPIYQAYVLKTLYKSNSALFGAFVFFLSGSRQAYVLFRLRYNIADARAKGYMIDHLTLEQWLVGIVWIYAIGIGFVIWLHWKRYDLKKLGL